MSVKSELIEYRKELQGEIMALPASLFPKEFQDFVKRGSDMNVISWNKEMIYDDGVPTDTLRDLKVLTEKRLDAHRSGIL